MNKFASFALVSLFAVPLMMNSAAADDRGPSERSGANRSAPARDGGPSANAGARQAPAMAQQRSDRGLPERGGRGSPERGTHNSPRAEPNRPGGMGAGPSFATPAPTQRIAPAREAQPAIQHNRRNDFQAGSPQRFERRDRGDFDRRDNDRQNRTNDSRTGAPQHSERRDRSDFDRRDNDRQNRTNDLRTGAPQRFERRDRSDFDRRSHDRHPIYRPSAHRPPWRGDIRHFHRYDFHTWQRGRWHREHHGGRLGWWWVVGPSWYFYPAPVYPYPNPYVPPAIVVLPAPASETPYWYYCEDPQGYYPYVEECAEEWQPVPAEPEVGVPPGY